MAATQMIDPDLRFIREIKVAGGDTLKNCYQCATCSTVCNLSNGHQPFPRKEMIWAGWGLRDQLMRDPDVWLCYQCNDCSSYCPRGARPGDVLASVRSYLYRYFSFPRFMGRALASPAALPVLLLVPALILLASMLLFAPRTPDGSFLFMSSDIVDFNLFLPHSAVDALFVFGNLLIFILAATGFYRFWRGLKQPEEEIHLPFLQALGVTVKEIVVHDRFRKCETNRPRMAGHMLLLFGFVGAMITTGMVFVFIFVPHYLHLLGWDSLESYFELPIELPNPVKILGVASGLALVVGGGMLIYRRWARRDDVGANGYADYLFLYMMFFVGLTGMLSWMIRVGDLAMVAYVIYFVHLVTVFFVLWYMPYSKFAHMIYRTLALVHARQTNRIAEDRV
jgi:quinone-modifying oxidoreductase subunit QmoC